MKHVELGTSPWHEVDCQRNPDLGFEGVHRAELLPRYNIRSLEAPAPLLELHGSYGNPFHNTPGAQRKLTNYCGVSLLLLPDDQIGSY
jgi:hypothetical protein